MTQGQSCAAGARYTLQASQHLFEQSTFSEAAVKGHGCAAGCGQEEVLGWPGVNLAVVRQQLQSHRRQHQMYGLPHKL